MSDSYHGIVNSIIDVVALRGSRGYPAGELVNKYGLKPRVLLHMARTALDSRGFTFRRNDTALPRETLTEQSIVLSTCCAPIHEIYAAYGVESPTEPLLDSCLAILEVLGRAGPAGFLLTELGAELNINPKLVFGFVDRLVYSDLIVKRSVVATRTKRPSSGKISVLHLKRFADAFVPEDHGYILALESSIVSQVFDRIVELLDSFGVESMRTRDVAKHLSIGKRKMQGLRAFGVANTGKMDMSVHFYASDKNQWMVRRWQEGGAPAARDGAAYSCLRNLPLYETVAGLIRDSPEGVGLSQIIRSTSCPAKQAARVSTEFGTLLGYPSQKIQDGRQAKTLLFRRAEGAAPVTVEEEGGGGGRGEQQQTEQQKAYVRLVLEHLALAEGIAAFNTLLGIVRSASVSAGTVDKKTLQRLLGRLGDEGRLCQMEVSVPLLRRNKRRRVEGQEQPSPPEEAEEDVTEVVKTVVLLPGDGSALGGEDLAALADRFIARYESDFYQSLEADRAASALVKTEAAREAREARGEVPKRSRKRKSAAAAGAAGSAGPSEADEEAGEAEQQGAAGDTSEVVAVPAPPEEEGEGGRGRVVSAKDLTVFEAPSDLASLGDLLNHYSPPALVVSSMSLHLQLTTLLEADPLLVVQPLAALVELLPVRFVWLNYRCGFSEQFQRDTESRPEYSAMVDLILSGNSMTCGELMQAEAVFGVDHTRRVLDNIRPAVSFQLLFLLAVGVLRNGNHQLLAQLESSLSRFSHIEEVSQALDLKRRVTEAAAGECSLTGVDSRTTLLCACVFSVLPFDEQSASFAALTFLLNLVAEQALHLNHKLPPLARMNALVYKQWRGLLVNVIQVDCSGIQSGDHTNCIFRRELRDKTEGVGNSFKMPLLSAATACLATVWSHIGPRFPLAHLRMCSVDHSASRAPARLRPKREAGEEGEEAEEDGPLGGAAVAVAAAEEEDLWSLTQDVGLVGHYLLKHFAKSPLHGMCDTLQTFTLAGRQLDGCSVASTFTTNPATSALRSDFRYLDFSHVSENLFRRCTARFGHSATAGKKRFFLLLRACPSLRSLLAQIVTYRQEVPVSEELRAVVNAMSGERCAGDEQQHRQAKEIGALALQMLYEESAAGKQRIADELSVYSAESVAQVFRELYVVGLLRKDMKTGGFEKTELLENSFAVHLAPFLARTRPAPGSAGGLDAGRLLPLFARDSSLQTFESLGLLHCLASPGCEVVSSVAVSPGTDTAAYNQPHIHQFSEPPLAEPVAKSLHLHTSGFCMAPLNRMEMQVGVTSASSESWPVAAGRRADPEPLCCPAALCPWRNSKGDLNDALFSMFEARVLAVLANKPGSSAAQIGAVLSHLGDSQVTILLNEMLSRRSIYWRVASMCARRSGPFSISGTSSAERGYFVTV